MFQKDNFYMYYSLFIIQFNTFIKIIFQKRKYLQELAFIKFSIISFFLLFLNYCEIKMIRINS